MDVCGMEMELFRSGSVMVSDMIEQAERIRVLYSREEPMVKKKTDKKGMEEERGKSSYDDVSTENPIAQSFPTSGLWPPRGLHSPICMHGVVLNKRMGQLYHTQNCVSLLLQELYIFTYRHNSRVSAALPWGNSTNVYISYKSSLPKEAWSFDMYLWIPLEKLVSLHIFLWYHL